MAWATPTFAADKPAPDFTIGKEGVVHFNVAVKAGGVSLEPGMYQLQHAVEGTDHYVSFKKVSMPAGYRHGNTQVAEEAAARVKCTVEPAQKVGKTALTLRTNAAGEKEIADVRIAGEAFKHTF
jgi:hypothetical protein